MLPKINRHRLAFLVAVLSYAILSVALGAWRELVNFPNHVAQEIGAAAYRRHARSIGKTVDQIAAEHYRVQLEAYNRKRASGVPECGLIFLPGDCAIPPKHSLPAVIQDTELSDICEGAISSLRFIAASTKLALTSAIFAVATVLVGPALLRRLANWLTNG